MEVYPHPALVELARADKRLPYKVKNVRRYWPELAPVDRQRLLLETWAQIVDLLDREIVGVQALLPAVEEADRGARLKAFEDMLDAVVCVWIGTTVLEGCATPYGDGESAIWIPEPDQVGRAVR
ncbi:DUF429 domain-containing protein [Hansschlegelia plantiphila]|uniref:DUF429 domain-containing protein n=1 Tax=Hansschlegelia plantiphila TaxID=374655 RepID=A0A9W6J211_9HYPH|nr:DUF429 domain-containing protein [Hansschlegelia plantiphila]GLK68902.1 hypothetical protein GCM10008179_25400 [Hansschlegelia plantiphila]